MPPRRRLSAQQEAEQLLLELGIAQTPVPVETVAKLLGAQVLTHRMDATQSGMTFRQDDLVVIGINAAHHPRRQRFTLAHEIGHVRLHPGRPLTVDSSIRVDFRDGVSSLATDSEEIEANAFGAALLMPATAVRAQVRALHDNGQRSRERLVADLSAIFDVSIEAMGYRLINLGLSSA